jgi:uridine kinase
VSRPTVILLAGGTASGKSTLAHEIAADPRVLHITHDRYYLDAPNPKGHNFDHPDALETPLLVAHIDALIRGEAADLPVYDFPTHRRAVGVDPVMPRPIILVEGILVMAADALLDRANLSIYVDAPADVRLARRIQRDTVDRGRSIQSVLEQYLNTVRPMHEAFVQPCASWADVVLDGTAPPKDLVDQAWGAITAIHSGESLVEA